MRLTPYEKRIIKDTIVQTCLRCPEERSEFCEKYCTLWKINKKLAKELKKYENK